MSPFDGRAKAAFVLACARSSLWERLMREMAARTRWLSFKGVWSSRARFRTRSSLRSSSSADRR